MFLLNLSSNLKGIVCNHSRMRVDKNLLLNIFKERCSIYFYLEPVSYTHLVNLTRTGDEIKIRKRKPIG